MHRAKGVEHDQVTHLPVVAVDDLRSGGVLMELFEQGARLGSIDADNLAGDAARRIEQFFAGVGVFLAYRTDGGSGLLTACW